MSRDIAVIRTVKLESFSVIPGGCVVLTIEFHAIITRANCGVSVYGRWKRGGSVIPGMIIVILLCQNFVFIALNGFVTLQTDHFEQSIKIIELKASDGRIWTNDLQHTSQLLKPLRQGRMRSQAGVLQTSSLRRLARFAFAISILPSRQAQPCN